MNGARQLNNFDMIRLFAAVNVMALHVAGHLGRDISVLHDVLDPFPGVPIFFVVSGFLISRSWERFPDWRQYLKNRALRIYPALWVCLVLSVVSVVATGYVIDAPRSTLLVWVVGQLTFGQFITPAFMQGYGAGILNGSLWTIPIELQFYLLLPLLLSWRPLVWLAAGASLVAYATVRDASLTLPGGLVMPMQVTLLPNFYMFALGILLARYFERLQRYLIGRAHWWLLGYAAAAIVGYSLGARVGTNAPNPLLMVLLGALVISCAYTLPELGQRLLRGQDISYGIYIYHMVVTNFLIETHVDSFWLAVLLTVLLAIASWYAIERPALSLKHLSLRGVLES